MATMLTLLYYGFLAAAYFGWGRAFILASTPKGYKRESIPKSFLIWTGWACTLLVFQIIHFFLPINVYSAGPLLFLGAAFSFAVFIRNRTADHGLSLLAGHPSKYIRMATITGLLLAACWLASRAMLSPNNYDSGLYHLSAVRWTNEYPLVPGLGNLHGRLAFNSSFFTYVAALNLHPFFGNGRSIANSFLLLLTVMTLLELLLPVLKLPSLVFRSPPMQWAASLFCLPIMAYWALASNGVSSPSPDLTSSLLQVVIFIIFVRLLMRFIQDGTVSLLEYLILFLLAATAITVKLSNVAFCGTIMVFAGFGILNAVPKPINHIVRLLLPTAVVLMVFCLRGIILSGAPLYPAAIGYLDTQWSVPIDQVINERNWVYSWARQPKAHWEQVLPSWNWFSPWLQRVASRVTDVVYPFVVFLACGVLAVLVLLYHLTRFRLSRQYLLNGMTPIPLLAALVFWFFTAPDPRFANGTFALLAVSAIVLLLTQIQLSVNKTRMVIVIGVLFVVGNLHFLHWAFSHPWAVKHVSVDGWHQAKRVPLDVKVTPSRLRVYVPISGDQCWDAPLPCTPYFNEELRLRDPDDIASGFTVRPLENNVKNAEPKDIFDKK